jgi:quinol-cytochrome oxidoreductase complex cytochrome b subunit
MATAAVPHRLGTVRRVLAWILLAQVGLLGATGVFLVVGYRPSPRAPSGALIQDEAGIGGSAFAGDVQGVHRWAAWSTVAPALMLAGVAVGEAMVRWRGPQRRRSGLATGPGVAGLVLIALVTGFALRWDQLGLRAVTVGSDLRGYTWLAGDDVRFVLQGGLEVSVTAMRVLFGIHALAVPALLLIALGLLAQRDRTAAGSASASPSPPSDGADRWH